MAVVKDSDYPDNMLGTYVSPNTCQSCRSSQVLLSIQKLEITVCHIEINLLLIIYFIAIEKKH